MATQASPTDTKKKRGTGPLVITYIGADNKEGKRVPENGSQLKVASRDGKSKVYSFDGLPVAVQKQLGMLAFAKTLDIFARNGAKEDGANVMTLVEEKYASLKDGKLYSRGEGKGGPGRSFDYDKWVTIGKMIQDIRVKNKVEDKRTGKPVVAATDKDLAKLRLKLESMLPKDRQKYILDMGKNPIAKLAKSQYEAMAAKKAMDSDEEDDDLDLF